MNIIMLLWWSLARGNPVVPSRWRATRIGGCFKRRGAHHCDLSPLLMGPRSTGSRHLRSRAAHCVRQIGSAAARHDPILAVLALLV